VFVEWERPVFISLEDDRIDKCVSGTEQGAGIRLIHDGKTAYAFSNELNQDALLEAASGLCQAVRDGRAARPDIDLRSRYPETEFVIGTHPDSIPIENKISMLSRANSIARGVGPGNIKQVSVIYRDLVQKVQIATSEGVLAEDERTHTVSAISVVATDGKVIQTGYEALGGMAGFELFDSNALENAADRAAARAVRMLSARRAPGGRMPVIISSEAGGTMIHEAIGHGLEADLALQGLSRYSGLIGKQVASPLVTVIDDATLPGKRGSFRFDDEGTPARRNVLVKDGILQGYMYDKLMCIREGSSCTGNGRRESYQHRPVPRMTNTFLAPGSSSAEDVLSSTHKGIFVQKMGGGQVDTVSGDFVFDVLEGYKIENGAIGEPLRGATLIGNGPKVLDSIDIVASDLGFSIGTCGKDSQGVPVSDAMPTVRIPEMVVGGKV
jgi:TldD protein